MYRGRRDRCVCTFEPCCLYRGFIVSIVRAVVAAALVASLTACQQSEPEPKLVSSETPTVVEPTEAATSEVEINSPEGLIRRWQEEMDVAQESGSVSGFRSLSHPDCKNCAAVVRVIKEAYSGGGSIRFDGTTIQSVEPAPEGELHYDVTYSVGPTEVLDAGGGVVSTYPAGESSMLVLLTEHRGRLEVLETMSRSTQG